MNDRSTFTTAENNVDQHAPYQSQQFDFKKDFHVSPFMPMGLDYRWRFSFSERQNVIHMQLFEQGMLQFDATLKFSLQAITVPSQQHRYAVLKVLEPFRMVSGIYTAAAFRLWKKRIHFTAIPKKEKETHCDEDTINGRAHHTAGGTAPFAEITPWSADF